MLKKISGWKTKKKQSSETSSNQGYYFLFFSKNLLGIFLRRGNEKSTILGHSIIMFDATVKLKTFFELVEWLNICPKMKL